MRKSSVLLMLSVLLFATFTSVFADNKDNLPVFLKNPSLSPDGSLIAFDFDGDIWTVPSAGGKATRLTIHLAHERRPYFSPDGKLILFTAAYYGNYDLYTIPVTGGVPKRLTYGPGSEIPSGWSADGEFCYFYAFADTYYDIFRIASEGGTPARLASSTRESLLGASPSNDGKKVAFNYRSGFNAWDRRKNVSPNTADIYIADNTVPVTNVKRMTKNWNQDFLPIWSPDSSSIYFSSDKDGSYNLYKMNIASGTETQITKFTDKGLRWFTVAKDSGNIVIERNHRFYRLEEASGNATLIEISMYNPAKTTDSEFITEKTVISDFSVAPDCKKVAFISGHDVFVMAAGGGYAKRLTETFERELHLIWAPDSMHVVFNRIIAGAMHIVKVNIADGTEEVLTKGKENHFTPLYSPDGKKIFYQQGYHKICSFDPAKPEEKHEVVVEGFFSRRLLDDGRWFDFSADGKWLNYIEKNSLMSVDSISNKLGKEKVSINFSILGGNNYYGEFSPDYKRYVFSNYSNGAQRVYVIDFEEDTTPRVSDVQKLEDLLTPPEEKKEGEGDDKVAPKPVPKKKPVEKLADGPVDITDLFNKTRVLIPGLRASHYYISSLNRGAVGLVMAYQGNSYSVFACPMMANTNIPPKPVVQSNARISGFEVNKQESAYYYTSGGELYYGRISRGSFAPAKPISPKTISKAYSAAGERTAIFNEALWVLDFGFYDPNHHGVDMNHLRDVYTPLVARCETENQFRALMSEMISELNASHMGIGDKPGSTVLGTAKDATPHIGFMYDNALAEQGTIKITRLIEGTPAAKANSGLKVGDYVVSVNTVKMGKGVNYYKQLRNTLGKEARLEVADSPDATETRVVYLPSIDIQSVYYALLNEWEEINRKYVETTSNGKFGYVAVRSMMDQDYAKYRVFIARYLANFEGVILDFRYNSGGRISHLIAEDLDDKPWLFSKMRGGRWVPEDVHRDFSVQTAVVGLFNFSSFSNAEMMLAGFNIKGLGPTVGTPSSGGVIGTWPKTLLDGTEMRLPRFKVCDFKGRNLELNPTKPQYEIDENFEDEMNGKFVQINKALELIKEEAKKKTNVFKPEGVE